MFFSHELGPVNPKAQGMVAPPEGLDLDVPLVGSTWDAAAAAGALGEPEREGETDEFGRPLRAVASAAASEAGIKKKKVKGEKGSSGKKGKKRDDPEANVKVRSVRLLPSRLDPPG